MSAALSDPTETESPVFVNISTYKFVRLDNLEQRQANLKQQADLLNLRGTVLLSPEGINLFVAGTRAAIDGFVAFLQADPLLADLQPKESISDHQPFNRMLVKIKKEIIAFGVESVDPVETTSPKLPARELKRWLDEGRKVHLLDTRNDYEVEVGTFANAIPAGVDTFREFPEAVSRLPESMKDEPVVMFCTGGIRCEKAGPFMEQAGFRQVFQLDGGILKYFEECGGDHYDGDCFVFDQRVAVNPALQETDFTQCYICQEVVSAEDQQLPTYVPGKSCPKCFRDSSARMASHLTDRQQQLEKVVTPLPGSVAYYNRRPLNVPGRYAGVSLIDFLCDWHPQVSRDEWLRKIAASEIIPGPRYGRRKRKKKSPEESLPLSPERPVREGERFEHLLAGNVEPEVNAGIEFIHEDSEFIVVNKPAPLPMHASGRFNRNTLQYILNEVYRPERPWIVHRLDAHTSGVVVLCRKRSVARCIQPQFEQRLVQKDYLARITGHPADDEFVCEARISAAPTDGGRREIVGDDGLEARTEFRVLQRCEDGTSIVIAKPVTGRTNQIRIHLAHLGMPVVGDAMYGSDASSENKVHTPETQQTMCLHATVIRFKDSAGNQREFRAPDPVWLTQ
jgi:RluA family pseudouridine synthase